MSSILPYKGKAMKFTLKVERTHVADHRDRHTVTLISNQAGMHARARSAPGSPQLSSQQLMVYTYKRSDIMSTVGF